MQSVTIPISFDHEGKSYRGVFQPVHGAGTFVWHLLINNYYRGQLSYNEDQDKWVYFGNMFEGMGDYFGAYVRGWIGRKCIENESLNRCFRFVFILLQFLLTLGQPHKEQEY